MAKSCETAMESSLLDFPNFDVNAEPTSLGINRFDNFLIALDVTEDSRQKALVLFYAGTDVHTIYNTLVNLSDEVDYAIAKTKLALYFAPSKNDIFEVYNFRSLQQFENEPIDTYITRLREAGSRCGFTDPDKEIKHQVVS